MLTYLSLCSGIEAVSVAWQPLGLKPWAFAENDDFPSAVLEHHYPEVPNLGDITQFKEWPDAATGISLLVGGTPCQSFSVAGLRAGLADPRGNLALTYLAIADRYRPRWVVWENVPGVLSSSGGRDFGAFLGGLAELGYGFAWRVLDAQYFGLAQRRQRVFVVGYLGDWRRAAAVLFERESLSWHPPPRREAGQDVTGSLAARTSAGGGLGTDFDCAGGLIGTLAASGAGTQRPAGQGNELDFLIPSHDVSQPFLAKANSSHRADAENYIGVRQFSSTGERAHCLNAGGMGRIDYESETLITHALRADGFDASEDGTGRGTPIVPIGYSETGQGWWTEGLGGLRADPGGMPENVAVVPIAFHNRQDPDMSGDVTHPIDAKDNGMGVMTLAIRGRGDSCDLETRQDGTSNAILTPNGGRGGIGVGAIATAMQVRRLTPLECCRLQGFPDDYLDILYRGKPAADGPKYKALGNSMAVPVMSWIGRRILLVESL